LYADLDNIRAAATWALDSADPADSELGVRILAALAEDFAMVARVRWALPSPERALDAARRSTRGRLAAVLAGASWEAQSRFDAETSLAYGREAYGDGLPADCPSPYRVCFALAGMGGHNVGASGLPEIVQIFSQFEQIAPPAELARICSLLVQGNVMRQDFDEARRWGERAEALARDSRNPSTIAMVAYHLGTLWARDEPARALAAYEASIAFGGSGANDATYGAALFQCALLQARAGDHDDALAKLRRAIEVQDWMNQRPQLEGALAYAIEIFTIFGAYAEAAILVGAAREGALTGIRTMTLPPERRQRSANPVREALGDAFDAYAAQGTAMSFDELVAWSLAALDRLIDR
jgi:tetratricopeptide (TPR) repeat protein